MLYLKNEFFWVNAVTKANEGIDIQINHLFSCIISVPRQTPTPKKTTPKKNL